MQHKIGVEDATIINASDGTKFGNNNWTKRKPIFYNQTAIGTKMSLDYNTSMALETEMSLNYNSLIMLKTKSRLTTWPQFVIHCEIVEPQYVYAT